MASPARSGIRMSAEERREAVVVAALAEFARGGLDGTSTEAIAARAGISQPYLFRLFPTKQAIYLAAVTRAFARIVETFEQASVGLEGYEALDAMGAAYATLISDRALLGLQLHAYASTADPEMRAIVRTHFEHVITFLAERTGLPAVTLGPFFAMGMLCNVLSSLELDPSVFAPYFDLDARP
jgi:AcrR family transcriptional regulator